ncbi:hypothetical protein GOBAR_DD05891 [Gossypium barbadense]|nr:hypothetical protein GOBAR_DD05891 [Gossypium barbadense]
MPRSSRHKSSKHSSRDYSDSEKDSGLKEKEKKSKEESSVRSSKELGSGDKRKLDAKDTSKEIWISGNGDYIEEYSSSKRRKEKADDGVNDRWNGGEDDDGKGEKKSKASSESKSKRREDIEGDDTKRSKSEGKHRESTFLITVMKKLMSDLKPGVLHFFCIDMHLVSEFLEQWCMDQDEIAYLCHFLYLQYQIEIVAKVGQSPQGSLVLISSMVLIVFSSGALNNLKLSWLWIVIWLRSSIHFCFGLEMMFQCDFDVPDRLQSPESESQLERRLRKKRDASGDVDKHLEDNGDILDRRLSASNDTSKDVRARDEKHKDERYKDKYREDINCEDKCQDDQVASDRANSKSSEKHLRDGKDDGKIWQKKSKLHDERRSARNKDSKGRKRSPDDRDDGNDTKSRGAKLLYSDMENKSASGRLEVDADRGRCQSRPTNLDAAMGSNRRRASPSSSSHGGTDEYRHLKQEDSNYRDPMTEQRSKAALSREVTSFSETSERGAKYRSMEKSSRADEDHSGELPIERSSSLKASPMSMMEKSPSTSLERRYTGRSVRRGLDTEETGWSSASAGGREEDNRLSRDLPPEKPLLDGSSQADSVFYNRAGQGNSSLISQPPGLRAGIGSPSFMGSLEEDNRFNNSGRYKRSGDLNVRRGHANAWRVAPNWPAPVPNSFIPFQPGPAHGAFQAMMPQFPSPSLFGGRPSMEINHSGIPYHIPDAERFNNHLRPMGWQNTMDGPGPAHFHGWDGHNIIFRDEAHMFGGPEWDQNRHPVNGRGWDTSSDVWKGQNGDVDLPSTSQREENPLQASPEDVYDGQERRRYQYENGNNGLQVKGLETRSDDMSPVKESSRLSPMVPHKAPDSSKVSSQDGDAHYCLLYLSKLDISAELAGSDLYGQCMGLLNVEQSKDLAKDVTMLVNSKNDARPVQNASFAVLSPSLIPATNASVFQKAMDLYKKQRLQMGAILDVKGGILAFASASKEKGKEQSPDHVVDEVEEAVLISDAEMVDSAMLDSDQPEEAVPSVTSDENTEQLVSIQRREIPDHLDSLSPEKSELPNADFCDINPKVPEPALDGNKAEETDTETEQMNSEDVVEGSLRSLDNTAEAIGLAADGENSNDINKTEGNSSVYCAEERHAFGDAISGSINDFPKESGALIPESNESGSESVILSRIHHSPENTH